MEPGDLLRIDLAGHGDSVAVLAFDPDGTRCELSFGLPPATSLSLQEFNAAPLIGWLSAQGVSAERDLVAVALQETDDALILKAPCPAIVWLVHRQAVSGLVHGTSNGSVQYWHQRASSKPQLPPALGEVRDEFTVPAGTAKAYELRKGESVQIIDVEGQQCSDF